MRRNDVMFRNEGFTQLKGPVSSFHRRQTETLRHTFCYQDINSVVVGCNIVHHHCNRSSKCNASASAAEVNVNCVLLMCYIVYQ